MAPHKPLFLSLLPLTAALVAGCGAPYAYVTYQGELTVSGTTVTTHQTA